MPPIFVKIIFTGRKRGRLSFPPVCATWALGREVCLPYYDHLRSRFVTSPLSLLLTELKVVTSPQVTCSFHPPATPSRSMIARSSCITCVEQTHLCLPDLLIQSQGHDSLYPNGQLCAQAKLLFPPPPSRHCSPHLFPFLALPKYWPVHHIHHDCRTTGINVVLHGVKATFLEPILRRGVFPLLRRTFAGFVFPSHPIGGADMEPF